MSMPVNNIAGGLSVGGQPAPPKEDNSDDELPWILERFKYICLAFSLLTLLDCGAGDHCWDNEQ